MTNRLQQVFHQRRFYSGSVRCLAVLSALVLAVPAAGLADGGKTTIGVPGVRGGVVTTSEPQAAQAGAEVLRQGGNAIDAAAVVQFVLTVVEPQSSGIGGGGFMMIHLADSKKTFVVDSRETAPAAADAEMFLLASDPSQAFSFSIRSTSGIAVGVPGTVLGVATALDRWGTISLAEAVQPAIRLAGEGFRVGTRLPESATSSRLQNELGEPAYDLARSFFRRGGTPVQAGDLLVIPDLATTFEIIAAKGAKGFYEGEIAEAIVATQFNARRVNAPLTAADQAKLRGRMTTADLANYEVAIREPVVGDYRGFEIVSMPPPSSGGLTAIYILKAIERFPIGDESTGFGFGATRTLNVMAEAMRLAFADRAVWMGDDDFVEVPSRGLISDPYIAIRSALIDPDARQAVVEADDPRPFDTAALPGKVQLAAGAQNPEEGVNTTHFTIIDSRGNIVTYTSTIESAWGTGLMVQGFGFLLNNELTDFNRIPAFDPDPANFNPGANDVAPGKRPRSSMAPTMVFRKGRPVAAYGSPGGSSIINSVVNTTINLIDHELTVQEAVDAPRVSQTSATGNLSRELGFSDEVIAELEALGHRVNSPSVIGSVQAVVVDRRSRRQFGAADKRRVGGVVSVRRDEIAGGEDDDDDDDDDD